MGNQKDFLTFLLVISLYRLFIPPLLHVYVLKSPNVMLLYVLSSLNILCYLQSKSLFISSSHYLLPGHRNSSDF